MLIAYSKQRPYYRGPMRFFYIGPPPILNCIDYRLYLSGTTLIGFTFAADFDLCR